MTYDKKSEQLEKKLRDSQDSHRKRREGREQVLGKKQDLSLFLKLAEFKP